MKTIVEPCGMYNEIYHGLTTFQLKLILPAIKREYRHAEKMVNFYKELQEGGDATERQTTAMFKWEDKASYLKGIIDYAKSVLK